MLDAAEAERRYAQLQDYAAGILDGIEMAEEIAAWISTAPTEPDDEGSIWGMAEMTPADAPEGFALVRSAFDYGILTPGQYEALQADLDEVQEALT